MRFKYCKTCKSEKPINDFGRLGAWRKEKCKECASKAAKKYAEKRMGRYEIFCGLTKKEIEEIKNILGGINVQVKLR